MTIYSNQINTSSLHKYDTQSSIFYLCISSGGSKVWLRDIAKHVARVQFHLRSTELRVGSCNKRGI